jgi:hypothetical protein
MQTGEGVTITPSGPAGLGCTGLAFDQLELDRRARVGRSERIALLAPASRNQQYTVGVAAWAKMNGAQV